MRNVLATFTLNTFFGSLSSFISGAVVIYNVTVVIFSKILTNGKTGTDLLSLFSLSYFQFWKASSASTGSVGVALCSRVLSQKSNPPTRKKMVMAPTP